MSNYEHSQNNSHIYQAVEISEFNKDFVDKNKGISETETGKKPKHPWDIVTEKSLKNYLLSQKVLEGGPWKWKRSKILKTHQ